MASKLKMLEAQVRKARAQARLVNEKLRVHRKSAKSRMLREEAHELSLEASGLSHPDTCTRYVAGFGKAALSAAAQFASS